jgi:hypothetical protein
MPAISAAVGQTGINKKHDVALVQSMLRVIKNAKGQPYASFGYDGNFTPGGNTFKAIKEFQDDNKSVAGPAETAGKLDPVSKTLNKMVELLPANYKEMRSFENFSLVYLPGSQAELSAALARVSGDQKFTADFKTKLTLLINAFYQKFGIVLSVNPDWANGGFRTFQEQRNLMDKVVNGLPVTQAGPGESNHNWGNGADVGFSQFRWLKSDGTVVKIPGVVADGDGAWLAELEKVDPNLPDELWKIRDQSTTLFPSSLPKDKGHLQTFSDSSVSMVRSLAEHLSAVASMWWEFKQGVYWCNYGLANPETKFKVGTAKRIWDKTVNVDESSLATALNQAEARKKLKPLPDYEEEIRAAITGLTKDAPETWKASDIKKAHCDQMRAFFRTDFDYAEASYADWIPYDSHGNALQ